MTFWEYTLTGFNDFLDQRRVAFTEPMPSRRVCSICRRLPSSSLLLPCGHVLCEECQGEVVERMKCPFDGRTFSKVGLVRLGFELSELEKLHVVCIAGGRKCAKFAGKLSELRDHMRQCRSFDVKCAKCHRSVTSDGAVDHYRQRCDGNVLLQSACDARAQRAVEDVRSIKEDLGSLRQQALRERDGDEELVIGANGLVERLTSLDRALSGFLEMASGVEEKGVSVQSSRNTSLTPGPFRAASKPGVFVATLKFTNVYAAHESLKENKKKKKHSLLSDLCMLGGYAFKLQCKFLLSEGGGVNVRFTVYLHGEWNDCLEWPFSKKVTLIIAHPTDETKYVKIKSRMTTCAVVKKPRPDFANPGTMTERKNWKDFELEGFVVKGARYVNVEFE
ncbi:hypothetical protein HPB49_020924 [Dermacentor silvarum]|uniref:Uncharacterized protein n=1 Tax=Dermacentor silvarum TaxID=543639 RepID=A0ACB8DQV5_DERSI|nr:hypothetical protein HPB49_020924 [Dermacentor silvarum]